MIKPYIKNETAVDIICSICDRVYPGMGCEPADCEWMKMLAEESVDAAPVVHWVLTDEKLPPEGQDVLCWYEYFRFGSYNRMFQTYGIGYQYNGMWGGEVAQGQKARVLAWMPLPETPKMDGGGNDGNV